MGAWSKKEIVFVDDLKGLRWRISGLGGPVLARVGVAPQDIPHFDVYAALEQGTIDVAEFICPHDDEKLGLPKVAKYNYHPCWWESGGMMHLVINLERWNALPKSYQAIVARACDAASLWMLAKYDAVNAPSLKRQVAAGAVLKPFPQDVMDAFYRAANEQHTEQAAKDAHFKKALKTPSTPSARSNSAGCRSPSTPWTASRSPCAGGPELNIGWQPRAPPSS